MKKNDMIDRYIYATVKKVPEITRNDLQNELKSLISDMLDESCGDKEPSEQDIREVLTELGSPNELANKYSLDADRCLIGGVYYTQYKYVLKIVLFAVLIGITISHFIIFILKDEVWYQQVLNYFTSFATSIVYAFGFVTLLFAFFYKNRVNIMDDSLDKLPPIPCNENKISKKEPIVGICFSVILAIVFIVYPQGIVCIITDGEITPLFNIELVKRLWYIPLIFALLGIIRESIKIIEGSYTYKLMITTVVVDIFSGILAYIWLSHKNVINSEFIHKAYTEFNASESIVSRLLDNLNNFIIGIFLLVFMIDIITNVVKTAKNRVYV